MGLFYLYYSRRAVPLDRAGRPPSGLGSEPGQARGGTGRWHRRVLREDSAAVREAWQMPEIVGAKLAGNSGQRAVRECMPWGGGLRLRLHAVEVAQELLLKRSSVFPRLQAHSSLSTCAAWYCSCGRAGWGVCAELPITGRVLGPAGGGRVGGDGAAGGVLLDTLFLSLVVFQGWFCSLVLRLWQGIAAGDGGNGCAFRGGTRARLAGVDDPVACGWAVVLRFFILRGGWLSGRPGRGVRWQGCCGCCRREPRSGRARRRCAGGAGRGRGL